MRILPRLILTLFIFITVSIGFIPTHTAHAATFDVCDLTELTTAITTANSNTQADTINFNCNNTLNFTSQFTILNDAGNGITINANGNTVIFDGGDSTRFFTVNDSASLTVNGLTLQNGYDAIGGAIFNLGTVTISNSTLSGNSVSSGGGAIYNNGTMTISNSTLSGNSPSSGGGAILNNGTLTISNSTLSGNSADDGGAIFNNGTLTISNSTLSGNSAGATGGAIFNLGGSMTISNSTLSGNSAGSTGGAILNLVGSVTISNSTLSGNSAGSTGGAILNFDTVTISNSTLSGNSASTSGGAIYNDGGTTSSQDSYYEGDATNNTCTGDPITDNGGNTRINSAGCPGSAPIVPVAPAVTIPVLGCALDSTDGVEVANAPDNTYCRILMKNGGVVSYSGAIPADLIRLGVILAVDVYRLEGGATQNTFPNYARVCLAGQGRLFYMDGRNAPRVVVELATETEGSLTCGWIPAPGTFILTN